MRFFIKILKLGEKVIQLINKSKGEEL